MKQFVPYEKLSKRERKARDAERRGTWGMSPVTRRPPNFRAYNRVKTRNWNRNESGFESLCSTHLRARRSADCNISQAPKRYG